MTQPIYLAFVWHMHQPYYRDLLTGTCSMPWVRLHGTKDYLDMVKLLEGFPSLHQTFNLVPSLLDQLEEYLPPRQLSDQFLDLSRTPAAELTSHAKRFLLEWFFMANWDRMVKPYPRYHDLLAKRGAPLDESAWEEAVKRFKVQDYLDLQVWFNLTWIDPWLRQHDLTLAALEAKGAQFTEADKRCVLDKQLAILTQIIPTYRAARERGQIELTTSPYYHPILPLLHDLRTAHMALPSLPLPEVSFHHAEDAKRQLGLALERHTAAFGQRPSGLWPPEGSVSEEVVQLAIEAGLRWIATDEEILWRTLRRERSPALLYRPHLAKRKAGQLAIVFRDRELSDLLGFVYSQWQAPIAIQDFLRRLEHIYQQAQTFKHPALVSIILDGENAWECYPNDGQEFLTGLYRALAQDDRFRVVTVSEFLDHFPLESTPSLPSVFAGSWIDGNFSTWVGHPEKNMAWKYLATVRQQLAEQRQPPPKSREELTPAWQSLYIAEGSDWMWWYGDTHHSAQDEEFDRLFRIHLGNVARSLQQEPLTVLQHPIKLKAVSPSHEPTAEIHPLIDGLETTYFEWLYAGRVDLHKGYAAIHRSSQVLHAVFYGFDHAHYYFRVDVDRSALQHIGAWQLRFEWPDLPFQCDVDFQAGHANVRTSPLTSQPIAGAFQRIIELAIPKPVLSVPRGETLQFRLTLLHETTVLEQHPGYGSFRLRVPAEDFEAQTWSV